MKDIIEKFVSPSGRQVRVIVRDGEPWFVAKDVCDILGTQVGHIRQIVGDKRVSIIHNMNGNHQQMLLVSEAGLYKLILVSRKKGAVAFQKRLEGELEVARRELDEMLPDAEAHRRWRTAWDDGMRRWHDGMVDPDQTRLWDDDREIFS